MDPLSLFPSEKTAALKKRSPGELEQARTSLDPGERAVAGLAASSSLAAVALPWAASNFALKPLAEKGSLPWGSAPPVQGARSIENIFNDPHGELAGNKTRFMGLFDVTGRAKAIDHEKAMGVGVKLDEMQHVVDSFIAKHQLAEKGVTLNFRSGPLSSGENMFRPDNKKIFIARPSKEIVLHELGHAADLEGSAIGRARARLGPMLSAASLTAVPIALIAGDQIKEQIPGTIDDKVISFLQDHAPAVMGATMAATTLYPEAKASFLAIKHIREVEGAEAAAAAAKKLIPAWGAYALATIPVMVGMSLARKYMMQARAERQQGQTKTAGLLDLGKSVLSDFAEQAKDVGHVAQQIGHGTIDLVKDPARFQRISAAAKEVGTSPEFVTGALVTAVPATLGALYMYSTKGGQLLRDKMDPKDVQSSFPHGPSDEEWRTKNPLRYAGLVGAGAAMAGGILAKLFADLQAVL